MKSKDIKKAEDAIKAVKGISECEDVTAFVEGDTRKTVQDAAEARLKELHKAGENKAGETDKITDNDKDFKGTGVGGKKSAKAEPPKEKNYVTGADHIKDMGPRGIKL